MKLSNLQINFIIFFSITTSILISTLIWDKITLPLDNNVVARGALTEKGYNPTNDTIRYIFFISFPLIVFLFLNLTLKKKIIGIRTSSYKMLKQADSGDVVELYDLVNDPLEEGNIVSSHPELVKEMESKLEKIMSSKKITTTENKVDLTKIESELEKLGYN